MFDLAAGIFWETAVIAKCKKYIDHLRKVVPKVKEMNGGPPFLSHAVVMP